MADEISIQVNFTASKGGQTVNFAPAADTFDLTGKVVGDYQQTVGFAAAEALEKVDAATLGLCCLINLDTTNFINLYTATGGTVMHKLMPGEPQIFRFGSGVTAPFVQADTGACKLRIVLLEI